MGKFIDYVLLILYPPFVLFVLGDFERHMGPQILGRDVIFYSLIFAFLMAGFFLVSNRLNGRRKDNAFKIVAALLLILYFLFPLWNSWLPAAIYPYAQQVTSTQTLSISGFYLGQLLLAYF